MELLHQIYAEVGPAGLILIALVFIVTRGQISFKYPQPKNGPHKQDSDKKAKG